MSLRLRLLKKVCALGGHQSGGRTAEIADGRYVVICNQCGEKVKT
jgi:hypothetical protein